MGLGSRLYGFGFRIEGFGFREYGSGFRAKRLGLQFWAQGLSRPGLLPEPRTLAKLGGFPKLGLPF